MTLPNSWLFCSCLAFFALIKSLNTRLQDLIGLHSQSQENPARTSLQHWDFCVSLYRYLTARVRWLRAGRWAEELLTSWSERNWDQWAWARPGHCLWSLMRCGESTENCKHNNKDRTIASGQNVVLVGWAEFIEQLFNSYKVLCQKKCIWMDILIGIDWLRNSAVLDCSAEALSCLMCQLFFPVWY